MYDWIHMVIRSHPLPSRSQAGITSIVLKFKHIYFSLGCWHKKAIRLKTKPTWALAELLWSCYNNRSFTAAVLGQRAVCPINLYETWAKEGVKVLLFLFLFPHVGLDMLDSAALRPVWTSLIYFLHLLWFLQQILEHSWSRSQCLSVCAWNQLCQHRRTLVRSGGLLWQRAYLSLTSTFSCSYNDTCHLIHPGEHGTLTEHVMLYVARLWHVYIWSLFVRILASGGLCTLLWFLVLCCGLLKFCLLVLF